MMPLEQRFNLSRRILKLGAFCDHMLEWLQRSYGIDPPMNQVALSIIFVISSYIPALIVAIFYTALCKKPTLPKFDPSMHVFNKPDAVEI